jgi:hypothetical protein
LGEAPAELERILRKALKKEREERYQSRQGHGARLEESEQELNNKGALETCCDGQPRPHEAHTSQPAPAQARSCELIEKFICSY